MTPALWRAARTDGLGTAAAADAEEEAGRVAFLSDLSVLMEGDVARRAARDRLGGALEVLLAYSPTCFCYRRADDLNIPVF